MFSRYIKTTLLTLAAATVLSACDGNQNDNAADENILNESTTNAPATQAPPAALNPGTTPRENAPQDGARQSAQLEELEELPHAMAQMRPTAGNQANGVIAFLESADNIAGARILVQMSGLTPGPHGFHIHETGDCSAPDASSAGPHFNPHSMPHGGQTAPQRHIGDLGNVTANEQGVIELDIEDTSIAFEGEDSILGRAVVVHANGDDYTTQPSGNSGDPVACGVITPTTTSSLL